MQSSQRFCITSSLTKYTHIKKRSKDLIKVLEKHGSKGSSRTLFSSLLGSFLPIRHLQWPKENKGPLSQDPIPNMIGRETKEENLLQYVKEEGTAIWLTDQDRKKNSCRKYNHILDSESPVVRLIDVNINSFIHVDALLGRMYGCQDCR